MTTTVPEVVRVYSVADVRVYSSAEVLRREEVRALATCARRGAQMQRGEGRGTHSRSDEGAEVTGSAPSVVELPTVGAAVELVGAASVVVALSVAVASGSDVEAGSSVEEEGSAPTADDEVGEAAEVVELLLAGGAVVELLELGAAVLDDGAGVVVLGEGELGVEVVVELEDGGSEGEGEEEGGGREDEVGSGVDEDAGGEVLEPGELVVVGSASVVVSAGGVVVVGSGALLVVVWAGVEVSAGGEDEVSGAGEVEVESMLVAAGVEELEGGSDAGEVAVVEAPSGGCEADERLEVGAAWLEGSVEVGESTGASAARARGQGPCVSCRGPPTGSSEAESCCAPGQSHRREWRRAAAAGGTGIGRGEAACGGQGRRGEQGAGQRAP